MAGLETSEEPVGETEAVVAVVVLLGDSTLALRRIIPWRCIDDSVDDSPGYGGGGGKGGEISS